MNCWCVVREERHSNVLVSQGRDLLLLNHIDERPQALVSCVYLGAGPQVFGL